MIYETPCINVSQRAQKTIAGNNGHPKSPTTCKETGHLESSAGAYELDE